MDAAVVRSTGGGFNDSALQLWAPRVGLGAEVGRLIAARSELSSVLVEAQGKEIQNQALVLHLREAWYKASRAADLLSELDYCRIHGEMERHDDNKVWRLLLAPCSSAVHRRFLLWALKSLMGAALITALPGWHSKL